MIEELELLEYQKILLKNRFLDQVVLYNKKAKTAEFFYILFSVFMTIGSIILPALLSIQQMDYSEDDKKDERIQITIYWVTWVISLVITISNALIQLLGLNKQYLSFTRTREKMLSEGWYYFQLAGDYKDMTHKNSFHDFCEEIEKIKESQVDKELSFMSTKKKKGGDNTPSITSSSNDNVVSRIPKRVILPVETSPLLIVNENEIDNLNLNIEQKSNV
tara:strand:+ start:129 stop:785 length:657 start_codon:yes stop_codon:yes gene_type:complete